MTGLDDLIGRAASETPDNLEFELAMNGDETATIYQPGQEDQRWMTSSLLVEVRE